MINGLAIKEKKINRIILLYVVVAVICLAIYLYAIRKESFKTEVNREFKGIITDKYRVQKDNPKDYNIKINDSIKINIPFYLISEIEIGDTVIKEKCKDYYMYYTITKIIKDVLTIPTIFGFPTDKRLGSEIKNR